MEQEINFQSALLHEMAWKYEQMIASTIRKMREQGASEATVTCKADISLDDCEVAMFDGNIKTGLRPAVVPRAEYKLTAQIVDKSTDAGESESGLELVQDPMTGAILVREMQRQMTIDDL